MKHLLKSACLFVCLLSAFPLIATAQTDTTLLTQLMQVYEKNDRAMMSIALSEKGKKVYARAIGYADLSRQQRADTLTQYHIGSITKMFTATMIFQLIEEGKLGLDTRLDHFFPSLPNSKQITIGLLLNHRSGLYNFTDDSLYERYQQLTKTKQQMLDLFASQTPEFEPDTKSSYSNTNYVLLGYILEVLTGKSYAENLQQRICTKIGLMHTVVAQSGRRSATEADSYTWAQQWKRAIETDMSIPGGAGAIIATPSDLCLFIEALFGGRLIKAASLSDMKKMTEQYGKGLFIIPFYEKTGYGHSGGIDGFESLLVYYPEDSLAMAITGNAWNCNMNDLAIYILKTFYKKPYTLPDLSRKKTAEAIPGQIEGSYENQQIHMKITVRKKGDHFEAQADGQSAFPLEQVDALRYKFELAHVQMLFHEEAGTHRILSFTLKQNGMELEFERN